jgi:DNA gyrase subunit A
MPLKEMLRHFVDHRHEVIVRRSEHDLRIAKEREHVLEGLKTAVDHIDEVIEIIRAAGDRDEAGRDLRERFGLSEEQSSAILNMRLGRLTGLEIEKLEEELREVRAEREHLEEVLASRELRMRIVRDELREVDEKYDDERRTEIVDVPVDFTEEDLIAEETMVITVSRDGYVKRLPSDVYRQQRRGGRGVAGMGTKDEDWVEHLFLASTHDYLMCFTEGGHAYWLKVYEIPKAGRQARGRSIVNLLDIDKDETIANMVPVREFRDDQYLLFATRDGLVKKTALSAYSNVRAPGVNAVNIREGDELIDVQLTDGSGEVLLATRNGMSIRFHEDDVRPTGRATQGVKGIDLEGDDEVVGMVIVRRGGTILTIAERGLGKRTDVDEYRTQRRGGKGLINLKITGRTGRVVAVKEVTDDDELMLVTRNGIVNRQHAREIRVIGRNTQGVKLIDLDDGDEVVDVARVVDRVEAEEESVAEGPEAVRELAEQVEEEARVEEEGAGDE